MNLPNKTKSFAWHVCRNIIPTKMNLWHRQVIDEDMYEVCGSGRETSGHIFWECQTACDMWLRICIIFETQRVRYDEFFDLIWYLMFIQHVGNEILKLVFMVAWCMWHNRNAVRHGSARQSTSKVVQKARFC